MKQFLLALSVQVVAFAWGNQAFAQIQSEPISFTISGKIDQPSKASNVILVYMGANNARVFDTVMLNKGRFTFRGSISQPHKSILLLEDVEKDPKMARMMHGFDEFGGVVGKDGINVYLDGGKITLKGATLATSKVSGKGETKIFANRNKKIATLHKEYKELSQKINATSEEARKSVAFKELIEKRRALVKQRRQIDSAFAFQHTDSYVGWSLVMNNSIIENPEAELAKFNRFSPRIQNSTIGKQYKGNIDAALLLSIGKEAPNFEQADVDGNPLALKSLRGKYVLIDFWASWCGPCRAENPYIVEAYKKYKGHNFEILGVSLDSKKENWVKAIEQDGLPWLQVSDLGGWQNAVSVQYGVRAIPQNYLLDPNGVIIASNLRGAELEKKLAELFK